MQIKKHFQITFQLNSFSNGLAYELVDSQNVYKPREQLIFSEVQVSVKTK
jgi:hypothetical protein